MNIKINMSTNVNNEIKDEINNLSNGNSQESNCRKGNWSKEDECMINNQIIIEMNAFHIYNFLYSHFSSDSVGFPGLANFFKKSSDEELEHARKFIDYQNIRGGKVSFDKSLIIPNVNFLDNNSSKSIPYQSISYALDMEHKVYESILNISNTTNDTALEDFLDDFLQDQLKDQYELSVLLKQLEHIGNNGFGLYQFDKELNS
jgi:ferritin heavy chain